MDEGIIFKYIARAHEQKISTMKGLDMVTAFTNDCSLSMH